MDKPPVTSAPRQVLKNFDIIGFVLFAPAAVQFLLALQYGGNQYAWNSATVIGLFCGAGGMAIIFLAWEHRQGDDAMIPFSMIAQRVVYSSILVGLFMMSMLLLASYYLPIYFQGVRGASPMQSGIRVLPSILSQLIAAVVSGALGKLRLVRQTDANGGRQASLLMVEYAVALTDDRIVSKLGYYLPWSVASSVLAGVGNGLLSTLAPATSAGKWIGYQIVVGAGRGCGMQMVRYPSFTLLPSPLHPG